MSDPGENRTLRYKDAALLAGLLEVLDGVPEGIPRDALRSRLVDTGLDWLPEGPSFSEELPEQLAKLQAAGFPVRVETSHGVERVFLEDPGDLADERYLPLDKAEADVALALHRCLSRLDPRRAAPQHPSTSSMKAYVPHDEVRFGYGGDGTIVQGLAYYMEYDEPDWLVSVLTDDGPWCYRMDAITDLTTLGTSPRNHRGCPNQAPIREPVGLAPHHYRESRRRGRPRPDASLRDVRRVITTVLAYGSADDDNDNDNDNAAVMLPVADVALAVGLDEPTVRAKFTSIGAETTNLAWYEAEDDMLCVEPLVTWARRLDAGQAFLLALRLACLNALDPEWARWLIDEEGAAERVDVLRSKLSRYLSAATVSVPPVPYGPNLLAMFLDGERLPVSITGHTGPQTLWLERLELRNLRWYGYGFLLPGGIGPTGLDLAEVTGVHIP